MKKLDLSYNQVASLQLALAAAHSAAQSLVNHMEAARDIACRASAYTDDPSFGRFGLAPALELAALKASNSLHLVEYFRESLERDLADNGDAVALAAISAREKRKIEQDEETYARVRSAKRKKGTKRLASHNSAADSSQSPRPNER